MELQIYDTTGTIHFKGENYLSNDNYEGKWFMTNDCNIPRKVISDEMIKGIRLVHLSNYPLNENEENQ